MKKTLLTIILFFTFFAIKGQPNITNLSYPASVNLFQKYEISFKLDRTYSNPYDPDTISVYAIFNGPNNRCDSVIGFYYEGYHLFMKTNEWYEHASRDTITEWRIRFTPDAIGTWYFYIHAVDQQGETIASSHKSIPFNFNCLSVSNAKGFISKANTRYLKRDVVKNEHRGYSSFFPVGPNVAWYYNDSIPAHPLGIFEYKIYIDSLSGNCNYMRVWLNRYQYLNLYGPEYTQIENGNPVVYFDSLINQKDAAELDYIIDYAAQHDIAIMPCFFTYGDFNVENLQDPEDLSVLGNNPYNTILGAPHLFFDDDDAQKITKNLIRYIIARWGYATNIMSWELWNEVTNIFCKQEKNSSNIFYSRYKTLSKESIFKWHKIMSDYIRSIDPFNHIISTSMSEDLLYSDLFSELYMYLDFVQRHNYQNINKAASKDQFSYILYKESIDTHTIYYDKPFFMGEFGFGQGSLYSTKDPHGIDLHNSLWSSLFSTSQGPSSFWWWSYLKHNHLFKLFKPILNFSQTLPILSDSFEAYTTGCDSAYKLLFPNNIETYYIKNRTDDTIYGWSQDTAFCYQSLRWLTDSVIPLGQYHGLHFVDSVVFDTAGYVYTLYPHKKPHPSSNSNLIKIRLSNVPNGTQYEVHWFNTETGLEYNNSTTYTVSQDVMGENYILIYFPSFIRNLNTHTITNTFGDVVFAIYRISAAEASEKKTITKGKN